MIVEKYFGGSLDLYYIVSTDGVNCEFCDDGEIKVIIYMTDYLRAYVDELPNPDELALLYTLDGYVYVPLINNARLL